MQRLRRLRPQWRIIRQGPDLDILGLPAIIIRLDRATSGGLDTGRGHRMLVLCGSDLDTSAAGITTDIGAGGSTVDTR
jgi:hypothetical protein